MADLRRYIGIALFLGLAVWGSPAAAQDMSPFDRAMAAVAASEKDSEAESRAMEQAVALLKGAYPQVPDAALESAAHAGAISENAVTAADYLSAASAFDDAVRLAPWVAEYHFNRGKLLVRANAYDAASRAFSLYLKIAPTGRDRAEVTALIDGLQRARRSAGEGANRPGNVFRDCPNCPEMVVIPAGRFVMGSAENEEGRFDAEGPQHPVSVHAFALGKYAVTGREFTAFLTDTGYQPAPCNRMMEKSWRNLGRGIVYPPGIADLPLQPAICINWHDAHAYITWLNKKAGGAYRLPSEAEWEFAARGATTTSRWWGNAVGKANANCHGCGSKWDNTLIAPVGSFGPNPFGLYDMLGNVWEWNEDCWNENYAGAPGDGRPWTAGDCRKRVMRGGSWSNIPVFIRSATRNHADADGDDFDYSSYVGFRLAKSLP